MVDNVEVYFICNKKEEMDLVETYYDEELNIHYWYFNAYLAYSYWKNKFRKMEIGKLSKNLLTVAASRYLIYCIENECYQTEKEHKKIKKELEKIQQELNNIIIEDKILLNL